MAKAEKIEDLNIKEYLYEFTPEKLNSDPFFIKVFGENFAQEKLKQNVEHVYVENNIKNGMVAYQDGIKKEITLCYNQEEPKITVKSIKENRKLQSHLLHESIHAVLTWSEDECKIVDSYYRTGLSEKDLYDNEIGRGLNEGYTEWLCERQGFTSKSYRELKSYIKLIELAVGTEKTMQLGKGDFESRFSNILNMPEKNVYFLLTASDSLYKADVEIAIRKEIKKYLKDKSLKSKDFIEDEEFEGFIKTLSKNDLLYIMYAKNNNKKLSDQTLVEYINKYNINNLETIKNTNIFFIENFLLDFYFKKELVTLFKEEDITAEEFKKIQKINSLLYSDINNIPSCFKKKRTIENVLVMKKKYPDFCKIYIDQVVQEDVNKYKNENVSLDVLVKNVKDVFGKDSFAKKYYIERFCQEFSSKDEIYYSLNTSLGVLQDKKENYEIER